MDKMELAAEEIKTTEIVNLWDETRHSNLVVLKVNVVTVLSLFWSL